MLTLYLILSISLGAMKSALKIIGWIFKWMFIMICIMTVMIPLYLSILFIMCAVSFTVWAADRIMAKISEGEPGIRRSPLNLMKNMDNLNSAFTKVGSVIEGHQSSDDNEIYVVRGSDLIKVKKAAPEKRPITLDEIILCDVILDD